MLGCWIKKKGLNSSFQRRNCIVTFYVQHKKKQREKERSNIKMVLVCFVWKEIMKIIKLKWLAIVQYWKKKGKQKWKRRFHFNSVNYQINLSLRLKQNFPEFPAGPTGTLRPAHIYQFKWNKKKPKAIYFFFYSTNLQVSIYLH